jgi:dUTP pyrophosphatase
METKALVKVHRLASHAKLPCYAFEADLCADLYSLDAHTIKAGAIICVPTGIAIELPPNYGAVVEDRSGLALCGIVTLGGVVDPGYRGEIKVILANIGKEPFGIDPGDRIAQIRLVHRVRMEFCETDRLSETARGASGYGSTGMK